MSNTITECAVDLAAAIKREDKSSREIITGLLNEVMGLKGRLLKAEMGIKNLDAQLLGLTGDPDKKQASDATIIVNPTQLTNMVFHELAAGLEGSGKICDVVQEFVSETVRTIMHDYVKDELEKMLPTSQVLVEKVREVVDDSLADCPQFSGKAEKWRVDAAVHATFMKMKQALLSADTTEDFGGKEKDEVK